MNEYRDCLPSTLFLNKPVHVKTQLLKNSLRVMVLKASSVNSKISSKTVKMCVYRQAGSLLFQKCAS